MKYIDWSPTNQIASAFSSFIMIYDALDDVLIAQLSFSSQGFFETKDDQDNDSISGRFEVITLRTYLYKHASSVGEDIPNPSDPDYTQVLLDLANTYLRRARVPGLDQ
ncbi:hypothetical protein G4Y79_20585 [Phototrophicus methaneseepsis]|uniref:Uncharacterized protein n=1 Tax=Phototrophicus methaneseepsis TaxID=2710758 RepID=A0A7S8E817_9CHLR|nr:hypothetical protein [Phototrophicus methaneseepsis]QPC82057.1 hypothetical protein G4Y79_20585 [Phototrophicus methaneseepsis]